MKPATLIAAITLGACSPKGGIEPIYNADTGIEVAPPSDPLEDTEETATDGSETGTVETGAETGTDTGIPDEPVMCSEWGYVESAFGGSSTDFPNNGFAFWEVTGHADLCGTEVAAIEGDASGVVVQVVQGVDLTPVGLPRRMEEGDADLYIRVDVPAGDPMEVTCYLETSAGRLEATIRRGM